MEILEKKDMARRAEKLLCRCNCKNCDSCKCKTSNKLDSIETRPLQAICPVFQKDSYDAIIFYDNHDVHSEYIMEEIYRYMKTMYQLRLCRRIDSPDLQRSEMMRMISKRCNHVIVLISNSYLKSEKCYADLYYMCITDPMAYQRKIIPVLIESMYTPAILMDRVTINYYRKEKKREHLQAIFRAIKPNHIASGGQCQQR